MTVLSLEGYTSTKRISSCKLKTDSKMNDGCVAFMNSKMGTKTGINEMFYLRVAVPAAY